jgi:hypothetical protein
MKAHNELSPFKSITQAHVDQLYKQICSIPGEYKRIKEENRNVFQKGFVSVVGAIKTSGADHQKEAEELVAKATEVYNKGATGKEGVLPRGTNPDLWQHEEKQRNKAEAVTASQSSEVVLITHTKSSMFDARPAKTIDDLKAAVQQLEKSASRSAIQERQLEILKKQVKIYESEGQIIPEDEIDHYALLATKYAELLSLLNKEFEKARFDFGKPVTKKESGWNGKEYKTIAAMEVSELIQFLNTKPKDHHLLRMITSILKERFSDDNRVLLSGIAFYDRTGLYDFAAFGRRRPFAELAVPDNYALGLTMPLGLKK